MSRAPLGRGLAALIPDVLLDDDHSTTRTALRLVPLDRVTPNPEQPRMTFEGGALEQLAESIRAHGVLTPILVRKPRADEAVPAGTFVLIAGERRLRASGLAGLEEIPVLVREDVSSREQLELALVENIQREDLDPIETAEAYQRLSENFGLTQAEVARRVGKDRATVANAIRLLRLPDFALVELRAGRISAGHAKALLGIIEPERMRAALRAVIEKDLSVRATERLAATFARPKRGHRKEASSPAIQRVGDDLSRTLGTRVRLEPRKRGERGRIVIDYNDHAELNRIVDLLSSSAV